MDPRITSVEDIDRFHPADRETGPVQDGENLDHLPHHAGVDDDLPRVRPAVETRVGQTDRAQLTRWHRAARTPAERHVSRGERAGHRGGERRHHQPGRGWPGSGRGAMKGAGPDLGRWRRRCRCRLRLLGGRAGAAGPQQDRRPDDASRYHPPADHSSQGTTLPPAPRAACRRAFGAAMTSSALSAGVMSATAHRSP